MASEAISAADLQRRISRYAGLTRLDIDAKGRRVDLEFEAQLDREDPWYDVRVNFTEVCYLRMAQDVRYPFEAEGIVDVFEERSDQGSDLIKENNGWKSLVLDIGSVDLANPRQTPPALRHFVLMMLPRIVFELLCIGAEIRIEPSPELAAS